jgi:hypothetical protein
LEEAASNDPKSYVLDKIDCKASFSWLLHLVRGGIGYPENTSFWLKVLFFKILPKSEEKKQRKEEKKRRKEEKKSQAKLEKAMDNAGSYEEVSDQSSKDAGDQESLNDQNKSNNKKSSENKTSDISASNIEASDKKDVSGDLDASDYSDEVNGQNDSEDHADKDSKEHTGSLESDDENVHKDDSENDYRNDHGNDAAEDDNDSEESEDKEDIDIFTFFDFIEKMADLFEKALDFLEKPGEAVEKAFYTISRAYDKMNLIKDLLDSPTFERAFVRAKKDLYLVLRHIMPGKIDADILLGIGDPASMGKLLAGVSVVNTFNDYDIWLEPDFENKVVEASVNIKGRIALWRLLLSAARVYFNKDIRKVKKRFDRIMKK